MGNLLQIQSASKTYGGKTLFKNETFAVNDGDHVAVIGPNGAGKTTLFRCIIGEEKLDAGKIVRSKNLRLGYLAQEDPWTQGQTVQDVLETKCVTPIWKLKKLGLNLGLTEKIFSSPVFELSGGYRMRVKLLYMLGNEPNLMLLDEPTNYLDLETLLVLENFLIDYKGAFLLISHDREFLQRTTHHVVEVELGEITRYPSDLESYFDHKKLLQEQLEKQILSQEAKKKKILEFAAKFGAKATLASRVQSRLKQIDRMENLQTKALPVSAKINLPIPKKTGKTTVSVKEACFGYTEKRVLSDVRVNIARGDHIGVVGVNGAGKSTFLKGLSKELEPIAGEVKFGHEVEVSYYAQHVTEKLNLNDTIIEALEHSADPQIKRQEILDLAGSLLFSGEDVNKRIKILSGGEKARVALAQVLLRRNPFLILDEPTNHLDFQTVEALTVALSHYPGTVVLVSHDRSFIGRVATKILEISDGKVHLYPGNYSEYLWSVKQKRGLETSTSPKKPVLKSTFKKQAKISNYKDEKKKLRKKIQELEKKCKETEKKIEGHKKRLEELNQILIQNTGPDSVHSMKEYKDTQRLIEYKEELWITYLEDKEKLEKQLDELLK